MKNIQTILTITLLLFFTTQHASAASPPNFQTHLLPSPHQAAPTNLRILLPDNFDKTKRYRTLYVLPVHEDGADTTKHGDGLTEVKKLNIHNKHQLICVAPSFTAKPWYADHDLNPQKQDESHLLKTVIPFVDKTYPTQTDPQSRLLIGFSKSGWGAITLLLRNPNIFYRAAAWDSGIRVDTGPITEEERAERIAREWGTLKNFQANRISNLIKTHAKNLGPTARLFYYNTEGIRAQGGAELHRLLVENQIPHRYLFEPLRPHTWNSGWIPQAIQFLTSKNN